MAIEGLNDIMKADSARSTKMDCTKSVEEYINREDWRIAANSNTTYSQAGLVNNLSGKAIANFFLDKLYTKKEGDSHRKGEYHIHDLDVLAAYCCGHDLQKLLNEGFNGVPGRVGSKAPKHVREALYQMANYIGVLQAEWAGAQAFSSFDTYLAPLYFFDCLFNGVGYDELKKAVANFVYNLNVPSRWGQCVPEHCRCLKADGSWVNGHFLKVGDEIAVVDGGKLSKARVEAVNFFDAPAVMHEYSDGLGRRFLVTPNHRVMVLEDGKPVLRESADILAAGKAVTIPLTRTDRPSADEPDGPVSDEILALAALAACRGHFGGLGSFAMFKDLEDAIANGRGLTLIVNAPDEGSPLAVQIEEVLDAAAPGSWRRLTAADSCGQYLVNGGAAAEVARLCASVDGGWVPMNRLERLVGMLSARQALIFLDTWCRFAGTMNAERGAWVLDAGGTGFPGGFIDNLWEIRQKALLTAAVKAGKAGAAMFSEEWGEDGCRGRHAVSILGNEASAEFTVREVPGSGKVWCPTTAAGTFIASPDMTRSDTELEDSTLTESSSFVFATGNSPFSNVTIDLKCPADLRERNPMRENKPLLVSIHDEYAERLKGDADLAARWERVVAELRRRLVAEDPSMADADEETLLYSACYRHFDPEMKQVFRAYYEVLGEGDAFGLPFTFPIPTVNITEDFDWDNPDYDIIWNETATYGSSYFQNFVGSQYKRDADGKLTIRDENAFSPGDVRSMAFHPMSHFEARVEGVHCMVTAREVYASVKAGLKVELRSDTHEFAPITEAFEIDYSQYGGIMHQIVLHGGSLCEPFMVSVDHKCLVVEDGKRVETVSQNVRPGHGMLVRDKAAGKLVERKVAANVRVKTDIKKVYNFTIDTEAHLVELANGVVSPQCCRLQLDKSQLRKRGGGLFGSDSQTGCYDDKTEVLTDSGWKLFRDVLPKDGIVTLDHDGRRRIQHAVRRFDTPYRGEMIRFEGEGVDLLVTPNHNMLDFRDDGMRFVTAENAAALRVRTESPDGAEGGAALYSEVRPVERVPYEGRIYCLEVPNHTLLVRRNGKACWCGNSVGVVTINLARLGYEHRGDMKGLKDKLFKLMDRAKSTLEKKRAFVKEMCLRGLYPYTRRYITSSLDGFSTFFTTIGVNGMNECIRNFTDDTHDITDEYGQEFAKGLLADVNARLLKYQEETGNLYNLEATPGEGCLAYDTGILTIDGSKPIGSLAGSRVPVLSWNKDTKAYEYKEADIVLDSVSEDIYRVEFDNGFSLECTSQHPFGLVRRGGEEVCWVTAEDLKAGDAVKAAASKGGAAPDSTVVSVERLHRRIEVFNAMVKDNRNFFVGDDGSGYVLTHNTTYRFAKEDQKAFGTADKVYVNCPEHGLREVDADDGADSACPECGAALQARRGIIQAGVPEAPYYTNSSQLPADFGEDVFSALDLQDDLQKCYTGGCVEKGNYVVTNHGPMLIEDIERTFVKGCGLMVASYNKETGVTEWDEVEDAMKIDVSKHDKIRVKAKGGLDITTSDWHPFFVLSREGEVVEKRADELREGDWLIANRTNMFDVKRGLDCDLAYLFGCFMLGGTFIRDDEGKPIEARFSGPDARIGWALYILSGRGMERGEVVKGETSSFASADPRLLSSLVEYGFASEGGAALPDKVRDALGRESAFALLSGLLGAGGCRNGSGSWKCTTRSQRLAQDVVWLCAMLGAKSSLTEEDGFHRVAVEYDEMDRLRSVCVPWDGVPYNGDGSRNNLYLVTEVSKTDVEDNQFYDLTTKRNHNYLCGKDAFVFIHNTVFHIYCDEQVDGPQVKALIRKVVQNYRLPYISFTASFSTCPKHGRIPGLHEFCPLCDSELLARHYAEYDPNKK